MKLSLQWLADHVDLSGLDPETIAEQLTKKIALIEDVEYPGRAIEGVVVGHVVSREPHPDADRLSFCRVDAGDGPIDVVCGAPNVAAGQKIAYAPVGCTLPPRADDPDSTPFTLERRKIRGVHSNGMICSDVELGLGEDGDGILVLPEDAPVGTRLVDYLGLDDALFEIDNKTVTHRADLWGHYGFARELSAIFGRALKPLELADDLTRDDEAASVVLMDLEGCPVYHGLAIEGVPGDAVSPDWIARRLRLAEMRPINLLVDLSNYVMLELGQPTHPFDQATLKGGVRVRSATDGETLETLDGVTRTLTPDDLVIADDERVVAIAGIMGGGPTEVSASTERVLLESANFDAVRVRKTSSRLALRTDALARFEKFVDPLLAETAVQRYAHLLRTLVPGATVQRYATAGEAVSRETTVRLRPDRARTKLGLDLDVDAMRNILLSIGFGVVEEEGALAVVVPSFRGGRDVAHEDDLIEEVGRLAGYDDVPSVLPRVECRPPRRDRLRRLERDASLAFVQECGYVETMNYSFASDAQVAASDSAEQPYLTLPHPITQDTGRLRRTLIPGLLQQMGGNQRSESQIRMLEVGRSYWKEQAGDEGLPREARSLVAGRFERGADPESLVFALRGDADAVFARLGWAIEGRVFDGEVPSCAHPGRTIALCLGDVRVGWVAQAHPAWVRRFDVEAPLALLELDLDVLAAQPTPTVLMTPLPQFPSVQRDVSLLAPVDVHVADIVATMNGTGASLLEDVTLFDVYQGEGIPDGHRSLAFRLTYRSAEGTLTDKQVEKVQSEVVARLAEKNLQLRG